jgi:NADH:ubiquinone oxidoreductase subunit 6 (subunit J)
MTLTGGILTLQCVLTILSGILTIIMGNNPINSVVFLVSCFVNCALIFVLLGVNLLGYLYIIVYVGAIAILFIFVIMMMDLRNVPEFSSFQAAVARGRTAGSYPLASMIAIIALGGILFSYGPSSPEVPVWPDLSQPKGTGMGTDISLETIKNLTGFDMKMLGDNIMNDFTTWEIAQRNGWDNLCPNSMNTVLHTVGFLLYTDFIFLLLFISLILLMVMISVIALIRG